jgi:hypothetical protein
MRNELCKFCGGSPQKNTFSILVIFRPTYMSNSDTNVGPVHCFLTGVCRTSLGVARKNHIIYIINHLIYKPTNALNKIQQNTNHIIKFETSSDSYIFWYRRVHLRQATETMYHQLNIQIQVLISLNFIINIL